MTFYDLQLYEAALIAIETYPQLPQPSLQILQKLAGVTP